MPITPKYPGVYTEEVPSGVRPITGVATSVTAFLGPARWGPVDQPVTSWSGYERAFGGIWTKAAMSYAVRGFYHNGGTTAIIVRLWEPTPPAAPPAPGAAAAPAPPTPKARFKVDDLELEAASAGEWGKALRIFVAADDEAVTAPFDLPRRLPPTHGGIPGQTRSCCASVTTSRRLRSDDARCERNDGPRHPARHR